MRLLSVNIALPREVPWKGSMVNTAIFKEPVAERVALRTLNLEGDAQADLTVHGGANMAVYAYAFEHYSTWEATLGRKLLPGAFGENFTTEGLLEDGVHIGDEFRVGTARLVVTQLRLPCYKLGIRFGDPGMVKAFLKARRPGWYFAVVEPGEVGPGDPIERVHSDERRVTVAELLRVTLDRRAPADDLRRMIALPALAAGWREEFQKRLDELS